MTANASNATGELVAMGIALVMNRQSSVAYHHRLALAKGATREEIRAALDVALACAAKGDPSSGASVQDPSDEESIDRNLSRT